MLPLGSDRRFGASPDGIFHGETCKGLIDVKTGSSIKLSGLYLLEVKTRAEGCTEPRQPAVSGSRVCQVHLQQLCAKANSGILQSFVPESNKSRYFLIRNDTSFVNVFIRVCCAILDNKPLSRSDVCDDNQYVPLVFSNLIPHN